jgi:hypothetical protein
MEMREKAVIIMTASILHYKENDLSTKTDIFLVAFFWKRERSYGYCVSEQLIC